MSMLVEAEATEPGAMIGPDGKFYVTITERFVLSSVIF